MFCYVSRYVTVLAIVVFSFINVNIWMFSRPVFEKYFYQAMQEMHDDNVMYVEFRASFSPLYEISGTTYNPVNVATIFKEVVDR